MSSSKFFRFNSVQVESTFIHCKGTIRPASCLNTKEATHHRVLLTSRIDGLTLEGYVIRAPRRDERVSIDTVLVPESAIIAHTGAPIDDERYPSYQHWLTLATILGLGEEAIPPDEMRLLVRDGSSTRWWWAWWD